MRTFIAILIVALWSVTSLFAQVQNTNQAETLTLGTRHSIYSQQLDEQREYWVYVPDGATEQTKPYPVLYLLDGEAFFHSMVGFSRFFSSSKISSLPPCIVVGILSTDRARDFTPTRSSARRDGKVYLRDEALGGGYENFYRFITEELIPEVERTFPADGRRLLVGHSYSALFTLQTLLHHPDAFQSFIAVDPSLWWDQGIVLKQASSAILQQNYAGKKAYLAFATQQRPNVQLTHFALADSLKTDIIPLLEQRGLQVIFKKMPEETHGTGALPGFFDGLKALYAVKF